MLQDPSQLKNGWQIEEKETHNADIKRIFERFSKSIKEADKKTVDDVNDIAWFAIIVWIMMSALATTTIGFSLLLCLTAVVVLGGICFVTYFYGHRGLVNGYFEDDLAHLEYYVQSRLSLLGPLVKDSVQKVVWKKKNSKIILYDFIVNIHTKDDFTLSYQMGIPSTENERFSITAETKMLDPIAREVRMLTWATWSPMRKDDKMLTLVHASRKVDLRRRSTFVQSPEEPTYLVDIAKKLLSIISVHER